MAAMGLTGCLYLGLGAEAAELHRFTDASDLIVLGDMTVNAPDAASPDLSSGAISSAQLIWGDPINFMLGADAADLVYSAVWNSTGQALPSNKGLWFIRRTTDGVNVLEGWAEASRLVAVRHRLVDQMVLARLSGRSPGGSPIVQLIVRNAHPGAIQAPDFRLRDGVLHLHPDATLFIYAGGASEPLMLDPLPGRQVALDETDWTVLLSGEEHSVTVDLQTVWGDAAIEADRLYFRVHPFGEFELQLQP